MSDDGTEAIRSAAWQIADVLEHGAMTWAQISAELEWSQPTMHRAARPLREAGVIVYDRERRLWALVDGATVPPRLRPRAVLVADVERREARA